MESKDITIERAHRTGFKIMVGKELLLLNF